MDFDVEEHELLAHSVREYCRGSVVPHVADWDRSGSLPPSALAELGELGLMGLESPEGRGGAELSTVASVLVLEELAAADGGLAWSVAIHNALALGFLQAVASEAQLSRWVPAMARGERLGTWAMAEAGAGSDRDALTTTARKDGDEWVLEGTKVFVTQAQHAGLYLTVASTGEPLDASSLALFVVEADRPGVTLERRVETMGMRSAGFGDVRLSGVRVSDSHRIGSGAAFSQIFEGVLDRVRLDIAAIACGIMRAALFAARDYSRERTQFGTAIAQFQAIQWKLADLDTSLTATRLLVLRAAERRDRGLPFSVEAAQAKLFASRTAVRGCSDALQVHGGFGYTREFPVERHLRDAKACELAFGTTEILRALVGHRIERRFTDT